MRRSLDDWSPEDLKRAERRLLELVEDYGPRDGLGHGLGAVRTLMAMKRAEGEAEVPCPCGDICRLCSWTGTVTAGMARRYYEANK